MLDIVWVRLLGFVGFVGVYLLADERGLKIMGQCTCEGGANARVRAAHAPGMRCMAPLSPPLPLETESKGRGEEKGRGEGDGDGGQRGETGGRNGGRAALLN